jgi:hypothetical protein
MKTLTNEIGIIMQKIIQQILQRFGYILIRRKKYIKLKENIKFLENSVKNLRLDIARLTDNCSKMETDLIKIRQLSQAGAPLFVDTNLKPRFRLNINSEINEDRIAVITIPKSGTYLLGAMLSKLGYNNCGIHAANWGFADLRFGSKKEILNTMHSRNFTIKFEDYIDLICPGEYVLSHLPANEQTEILLHDFKKIIAIREIRACIVSFMRYTATHNFSTHCFEWKEMPENPEKMLTFLKTEGENFFLLATPVIGWLQKPNVCVLKYEELMGDMGELGIKQALQRIYSFLSVPDTISLTFNLDEILAVDTITKSDKRSFVSPYWNDDVEALFVELGGQLLNDKLGYKNSWREFN